MAVKEKKCTRCGVVKNIGSFHKRGNSHNRYRSNCKLCTNARNREYWLENITKMNLQKSIYRLNHSEEYRVRSRMHYYSNKELYVARDKRRDALIKQASLGKNPFTVQRIFWKAAKIMSIATGIKHSIDHIVPIKGRNVSGLNVEWNLRIIPLSENRKKFNKVICDGNN